MNKRITQVLIVGAGFMGKEHAKAYLNIEDVQIIGIMEKNKEKASMFSEDFHCEKFNNLKDALQEEVDFVDICLPTLFHKDTIIDCFKAGKDVICEKPISLSIDDAQEIVSASKLYGKKLMIAQVVRFWPEYKKLSDMMKSKEISGIKCATFSRYQSMPKWSEDNWIISNSKSGGIIYDLAIHDIDFAISIFGMPEWVFARKTMIGEDCTIYLNSILGYNDVNVLIESGSIMPRTYPHTAGFRVSTGDISLEYLNRNGKGLIAYSNEMTERKLDYPDLNPYEQELRYFVTCIKENRKPLICTGTNALNALKLARYIDISADKNEKVEVV